MKKTGQQSSTADRPRVKRTTPRVIPLRSAIALDQQAAATVGLVMVESARWDGHGFRIPRGGLLEDYFSVPPEFTRDIRLGRLQAAIRERAAFWQGELAIPPGVSA